MGVETHFIFAERGSCCDQTIKRSKSFGGESLATSYLVHSEAMLQVAPQERIAGVYLPTPEKLFITLYRDESDLEGEIHDNENIILLRPGQELYISEDLSTRELWFVFDKDMTEEIERPILVPEIIGV